MSIYGSSREIEEAKLVLLKIQGLEEMKEGEARLKIQDAISEHNLKADILYDGNTVYKLASFFFIL